MDFQDAPASGLESGGVVRLEGQVVHQDLLDHDRRRQIVEGAPQGRLGEFARHKKQMRSWHDTQFNHG